VIHSPSHENRRRLAEFLQNFPVRAEKMWQCPGIGRHRRRRAGGRIETPTGTLLRYGQPGLKKRRLPRLGPPDLIGCQASPEIVKVPPETGAATSYAISAPPLDSTSGEHRKMDVARLIATNWPILARYSSTTPLRARATMLVRVANQGSSGARKSAAPRASSPSRITSIG
jgi:hypothetical protein